MTPKIRTRIRPDAILATLALVVALGGTSVAASLIRSIDIADHSIRQVDLSENSVGSAQVIDGALRMRDLNTQTKTALGGGYGASSAPSQSVPKSTTDGFDDAAAVTLITLPLPAGDYVVSALGRFNSTLGTAGDTQANEVFCRLGEIGGEGAVVEFDLDDALANDKRNVPFQLAARNNGGGVALRCSFFNPGTSGSISAQDLSITAVRVVLQ